MTKIIFNNTEYTIDESSLYFVKTQLQSHLSNVMGGTGDVIYFGDNTYDVDSTKLTTATNNFISHLGTISGSGTKVVVNNVEYAVDSTKIASALSELENTLRGLEYSAYHSMIVLLADGEEIVSSDGFKIMLRGE